MVASPLALQCLWTMRIAYIPRTLANPMVGVFLDRFGACLVVLSVRASRWILRPLTIALVH